MADCNGVGAGLRVELSGQRLLALFLPEQGNEIDGHSSIPLEVPMMVRRRGVETRLIVSSDDRADPDDKLVRLLAIRLECGDQRIWCDFQSYERKLITQIHRRGDRAEWWSGITQTISQTMNPMV
jgi:hypothetical protein